MKNIFYLILLVVLVSCSASEKCFKQGNYDKAIDALELKIQKQPSDSLAAGRFVEACQMANSRDTACVVALLESGQPDIWGDILDLYQQMEQRQQRIADLADTVSYLKGFQITDYSSQIKNARTKAAVYYYEKAEKLLQEGGHENTQMAYRHLLEVQKLMPGFRDVEKVLGDFTVVNPMVVFYEMKNKYPGYLFAPLDNELEYLDLSTFNSKDFIFVTKKSSRKDYHIKVSIEIHDILISPENTRHAYYTETAGVQDGIGYQLDSTGHFIYDSLGKKIEFPLLKTIACYVTETLQEKALVISGLLEISDASTGEVLQSQRVKGETKFLHRSAKFKGDINALSPETMELLGSRKAEYPQDEDMLLRAADELKMNALALIMKTLDSAKDKVIKKE